MIALVPIKRHSERLPNKNFRDFCGKPLYRWVLDTLLDMPEVSRVVVNTDCPELIQMQDSRLFVRTRKPSLCGDHVSMNEIIRDDLGAVDDDLFLQTHVTNPLLSEATIRKAVFMLAGHDTLMGVDVVRSRCSFADGMTINHGGNVLARTQDLPPVLVENSNLFLFSREAFEKYGSRVGGSVCYYEIPRWQSVDIDTHDDWRHAELIAKGLQLESNCV